MLAVPLIADTQQPAKIPKIGVLEPGPPPTDALMLIEISMFSTYSDRLAQLALAHRLPTITAIRTYAQAGGLISYGTNYPYLCRRSAVYVDKLLKGAKPGDLPIEQSNTFELVINLKTAKALGITIPPVLLFRADEVLQ